MDKSEIIKKIQTSISKDMFKRKQKNHILSETKDAYISTQKNEQSGIETSNIIEEKLSDMSFSLNFKDIIGSIEEKEKNAEVEKMKLELQQKD